MKLHAWSTAEASLGLRHLSVEWAHGTKNHTFQKTEIWLYNLYFHLHLSSLLRDGGSRNKDRMSAPRVSLAIIQGGGSKEQAWPSGDGGTKAQLQAHCFSLTHKATACHPLVKLDLSAGKVDLSQSTLVPPKTNVKWYLWNSLWPCAFLEVGEDF